MQMQTLIQTASTTYVQDADGDIFERRHATSRCKPTEKRFFSKLNQTITQNDIEREREYQELEQRLRQMD
jgi:hypothetical protein